MKKKKYSLFTILAVLLLLIIVATNFIDGRNGEVAYLPIVDAFLNFVQSFYYFFDTAIFILVVGGFYGFLNRIPAYKKLVKTIADKVKKRSKLFVAIVTIIFALLASLTGLNLILLLFIPFIVSIILILGYDKLVAISATFGATLIGIMGGIFITVKDPESYYETTYTTISKLSGLKSIWSNIIPQAALLVVAIALLVFYIINHIKKVEANKVDYKLSKSDNLFIEAKDRNGKVITADDSKTIVWPIATTLFVLLAILVLGYLPWKDLFGFECFNKFHTWLTGLKIGDYTIFTNLISTGITAFGTWNNLGNYMVAIVILTIFMLITMLIYRVKFEDAMDGFIYGMKKMLPATIISMLAFGILVSCYNNGFFETIVTSASKEFGDNVVIHSLITALGSLLHVDLYYSSVAVFTPILNSLTETANLSIYAIMLQSVYGLIHLVGPTSILLIVGLTYLDVPYKTWLKYIWRLILGLIIIILITLMIISMI